MSPLSSLGDSHGGHQRGTGRSADDRVQERREICGMVKMAVDDPHSASAFAPCKGGLACPSLRYVWLLGFSGRQADGQLHPAIRGTQGGSAGHAFAWSSYEAKPVGGLIERLHYQCLQALKEIETIKNNLQSNRPRDQGRGRLANDLTITLGTQVWAALNVLPAYKMDSAQMSVIAVGVDLARWGQRSLPRRIIHLSCQEKVLCAPASMCLPTETAIRSAVATPHRSWASPGLET